MLRVAAPFRKVASRNRSEVATHTAGMNPAYLVTWLVDFSLGVRFDWRSRLGVRLQEAGQQRPQSLGSGGSQMATEMALYAPHVERRRPPESPAAGRSD